MSETFRTDSEERLEGMKEVLEAAGAEYEVRTEYVVAVRENGGQPDEPDVDPSENGNSVASDDGSKSGSQENADNKITTIPREGTVAYETLAELARADEKWLTFSEVADRIGANDKTVSAVVSKAKNGGLVEAKELQRENGGRNPLGYRLTELYRRELLAECADGYEVVA